MVYDCTGGRVPRILPALTILAVLLGPAAGLATPSDGLPGAVVQSPPDGSILNATGVNVTGTASGASVDWIQTSHADFTSGQLADMHVNAEGSLELDLNLYDNFNDNQLDYDKWDFVSANDINFYENNLMLGMSGTGSPSAQWNACAIAYSKTPFPNAISSVLFNFYAVGTGSRGFIGLYQDDNNQVFVGMARDCEISANQTIAWWGYVKDGSRSDFNLGQYGGMYRLFAVNYANGVASVYIEGAKRGEIAISLANTKGIIGGRVRGTNDIVSVYWDNASTGDHMVSSGRYLSPVCDTHCSNPIIKKVEWAGSTPPGTGISVQVRSSDTADMASAGPWMDVENGQMDNLQAAKRFIQYRAFLNSPNGTGSPIFNQMKISYYIPVRSVEISADEQATWVPAIGLEQWYLPMTIPDNASRIWIRTVDESGAVGINSISVKVDLSPPTGTISINGGAKYTADRKVVVAFAVADNTGIKSFRLSETPDFGDAIWMPYQPSAEFTFSMGDGLKTVYAALKDAAGWETTINSSIFLYTGAPTGSLVLDHGAPYTSNAFVTLMFESADPVGIGEVLVSNKADFQDAKWEPYKQVMQWDLIPGNGPRTVYARVRNLVGTASAAFNDSIILDTVPPAVRFVINNGSAYTNSSSVALYLDATDNYFVESIRISEERYLGCSTWEPYSPVMRINLSQMDGPKTVFCQVRDGAGNAGPSNTSAITLDTAAPAAHLQALPPNSYSEAMKVSWSGTDQTSGIASFDVQVRDGPMRWTDWLVDTKQFSGNFTGVYGHQYYFRVRARDNAGNAGSYPDSPSGPVSFVLPDPAITISNSPAMTVLTGQFTIKGTSDHPKQGMTVTLVEVRIDGGTWSKAKGTANWSYVVDTTKLSNGPHILYARAFDGSRYSAEASAGFNVSNTRAQAAASTLMLPILVVVLIAGIAGAVIFIVRRRPSKDPPPVPLKAANPAPPAVRGTTAYATVPPPPVAETAGSGRGTGEMPAHIPPGPSPSNYQDQGAPPPADIETVAMTRTVDETVEKEKRVLKGLSYLPRGLPSSLAAMDMTELVEKVANAEEKIGDGGERLVMVNGRWYYGDDKDPRTFLQEYR